MNKNDQQRDAEFKDLLREITRVQAEIRDAKRFDVYKQLHQNNNDLNQDMTGEDEVVEEEQYEEEGSEQMQ